MAGGKRKADLPGDSSSSKAKSTVTGGSSSASDNPPPDAQTFIQEVRELNKQFSSWVNEQLSKNSSEFWTEGVNDYIKYTFDIKDKYKEAFEFLSKSTPSSVDNSKDIATPEPSTPFQTFFNSSSSSLSSTGTDFVNSTPFPITPLMPAPLTSSLFSIPSFNSFMSNATPSSTSLFSSPLDSSKPSDQTQTSFSQSQGIFGQSQSQGLFSNVPNTTKDDNNASDEEEKPGSPSIKSSQNSNENVLFNGRAKLFIKARDGGHKPWKDMGVGQLCLKKPIQNNAEGEEDEKEKGNNDNKLEKPYLTFVNDVGRRLLNALLYAKMKVVMNNNNLTMLLFSSHDSAKVSKEPEFYLIRFSNKKDAESLKNLVLDNAPKL